MMLRSIGNFYGSVLLKINIFGHPCGRALLNFGNLGQASVRKLLSVCNLGRPEGKAPLNPDSALLIVCNLREPYGGALRNYDKCCGNLQQSVSEILQSWDAVWQRAYYFHQSTSESLLWQRAPDMSKSQGTMAGLCSDLGIFENALNREILAMVQKVSMRLNSRKQRLVENMLAMLSFFAPR